MAAVILYDGYCVLCNGVVRFLEARQKPGALSYVSQQSDRGQQLLQPAGRQAVSTDTVILLEGERAFLRSAAVLRALRYLRFPWPLLYIFIIVPPFLRDPVYNFIAHNRSRWFGRMPRE